VSEQPSPPHRRHDPLRDTWVLVSEARGARPWRGQLDLAPVEPTRAYDPACELCPGNLRASGIRNPAYLGTFAFDNDFPALLPAAATVDAGAPLQSTGIHRAEPVAGSARVLCYTPRHDLSLATLEPAARRALVDAWAGQTTELGASHRWVQVFENRGAAMGASNPHPHGQVWASSTLPTEAAREDTAQRRHKAETGRALLDDVFDSERGGPRVVTASGSWLAIVPFWAAWPYETLVLSRGGEPRLDDLAGKVREELAGLLGTLMTAYDRLFDRPFPYSMGWHQAPFMRPNAPETDQDTSHWRLHGHVYPPLLRADARKFMVGYELLAEPQRDLTPEDAAARLSAAVRG
jgi:UDPglucose--hexose-1-phosphate uridylyltransferase